MPFTSKRISFDSYDYVLLNTFEIDNVDVDKAYEALKKVSDDSLELILVRDSSDETYDFPEHVLNVHDKKYKHFTSMYKQMFELEKMEKSIYNISSALIRVKDASKVLGPAQIMGLISAAMGYHSECKHSTLGLSGSHIDYVMTIDGATGEKIKVLGIYTDSEKLEHYE
jgi:hypothetical protein